MTPILAHKRYTEPSVFTAENLLREGTSYHYLPPGERASLRPELLQGLRGAFTEAPMRVHCGTAWTTDAPFRETASAIAFYRKQGVAAVEMEAAALYAFSQARGQPVVCFAHVTNQMAVIEGDFEKGSDHGSHDALDVIRLTARAWLAANGRRTNSPTIPRP